MLNNSFEFSLFIVIIFEIYILIGKYCMPIFLEAAGVNSIPILVLRNPKTASNQYYSVMS
jgi:hypothetical protein